MQPAEIWTSSIGNRAQENGAPKRPVSNLERPQRESLVALPAAVFALPVIAAIVLILDPTVRHVTRIRLGHDVAAGGPHMLGVLVVPVARAPGLACGRRRHDFDANRRRLADIDTYLGSRRECRRGQRSGGKNRE